MTEPASHRTHSPTSTHSRTPFTHSQNSHPLRSARASIAATKHRTSDTRQQQRAHLILRGVRVEYGLKREAVHELTRLLFRQHTRALRKQDLRCSRSHLTTFPQVVVWFDSTCHRSIIRFHFNLNIIALNLDPPRPTHSNAVLEESVHLGVRGGGSKVAGVRRRARAERYYKHKKKELREGAKKQQLASS